MFGHIQTIRSNQHELLDAMTVFARKLRAEIASHRKPDEVQRIDLQSVEQFKIVHHIIVNVRECRIVAGFTEARMIRDDDTEFVGPGFREIETVYCAGAVEYHERFTFAGGVHHGLHAVDRQFFAHEFAHCTPPDVLRRGMTCSANSVMFFTVFQCGMSAKCITLLIWFVPMRSAHSPIWFATFSGVPTAIKNELLMALKSNPPCILSAPAARIFNCSTER